MNESLFVDVQEKGSDIYCYSFPINTFSRDLYHVYRSSRISKIYEKLFSFYVDIFELGGKIKFNKFFAPEMYYLLRTLPRRSSYAEFANLLLEKTWLSQTRLEYPSDVNISKIHRDVNFDLKPYQLEFIETYTEKKKKYNLKGYLLAFEMGLGKTFTSLALMHGLSKDSVIIVAPKNTLVTVWKNEINKLFKKQQDIWVIGDKPRRSRFYLVNYESLDKLSSISQYVSDNVGIIVDECHNFRNENAKRVLMLQKLALEHKCDDILMMSGTPIKAMGSEMIPLLMLLDPLFDSNARDLFVQVFGLSREVASDILKHRLGLLMHRKKRSEVLNLPEKHEEDIKITFPNAYKYTTEHVKQLVYKFKEEREEYYKHTKEDYEKEYNECLSYIELTNKEISYSKDYIKYLNIIKILKKTMYVPGTDPELQTLVIWANKYEKDVLYNMLSNELKRKFKRSKAVVKYVNLKIMGEIIGGLLTKLRSEMTSEMMKNSPICSIISKADKKTVCFTNYVDVAKIAEEHLSKNCGMHPLAVHGDAKENSITVIEKFKKTTQNPIIATVQSLSTGVTLTEANTVIFLNLPWRSVDKNQAMDRVYRIGQDVDVYVYTFILDTGLKPNLSTRMEDIVNWSRQMFEQIVGN